MFGDEVKKLFLETVGEMFDRFDVDVFPFVLMSNRYHLLLRTNLANLSRAMQWLGVTHTRRFNNRHGRKGHLFLGGFKSILVENYAYVVELSCYIHRNPLRSGTVKRFRETGRLYGEERQDSDILVNLLWERGAFTNHEIGEFFGASYSAVSHIVRRVRSQMREGKNSQRKMDSINSQIKMEPMQREERGGEHVRRP